MECAGSPECKSTPTHTNKELVGWVLESSGRGTLGVILSCLSTIFLCVWVSIHARVSKCRLHHRLHKAVLLLKFIIAPEFIAVEGLQEWSQARRMVKNCRAPSGGHLKLVHAFYIGMLALRYRTPQGEKVIWPNQYTWLLEQGLIQWEDHASWGLSEDSLRDKSNTDGAAKLLALGQVSWFVVQSIIRTAHDLPISQLETMTLSYIPLVALTYFFWWIKPKDVMTASVVDLPEMTVGEKATFETMAVSDSFDNEGTGKQQSLMTIWTLTPRVFEKEAENRRLEQARQQALQEAQERVKQRAQSSADSDEQKQANATERECGDGLERRGSKREIVVACWDPEVYHSKLLWPITCLFGASFPALHLISWYSQFPTFVEQWLWRIAALVSITSMLVFMQYEKVVLRWGGLLTIISLASPMLYLFSRIVMIGGVIAAFRASDPAIYDTYSVSTYWIHIL